MEKEINDLKQIYLETKTPFDEAQGFADVMMRVESQQQPAFQMRFVAMGLAAILLVFAATLVVFPESKAASAIKAAGKKTYEAVFNPTASPTPTNMPLQELKRKPTDPPTATPTKEQGKSTSAPGQSVSSEKRNPNSVSNNGKVKGTSTHNPTSAPSTQPPQETRGNSEQHRNDTQEKKNENNQSNSNNGNGNGNLKNK